MIKGIGLNKTLVSVADQYKHGHSRDIEYVLESTKLSEQFKIYGNLQKTPDSLLQLALEEILISDVVLLDAIRDDKETYKDRLIQFGIAFALEKQRYLYYIKENSAGKERIASSYTDPYLIEASSYHGFIDLLDQRIELLRAQTQTKPQKPTDRVYEEFSVIGANESTNIDLTNTIKNFAMYKGWRVKFYKPPSGINIHEELSYQVGARTFSLFCINAYADFSVYIAIGLALGLGVPLLIIVEEETTMPQILSGYAGVISYKNTNKAELERKLSEYSKIFFSPEIFKTWDGFTYFYLLSKMEKRLNEAASKTDIEEIERIILAVTNVGRAPIVQAYILVGDVYRRKGQIIDQMDTTYLKQALLWYEKALNIQSDNQRCIDAIETTKKLIQLIDLLIVQKYSSLPELIHLIGNNIDWKQYQYLKSFLIGEVKKLIKEKEFLLAIALLAAMQKHDNSKELNKLWESINPRNFLETIQKYQQSEIMLKTDLKTFVEKNTDLSSQLNRANKAIEQANQLQAKLESTVDYYGQQIFVNFGVGWAAYTPIEGLPYVIRNGEKILAKETMPLLSGDTVYDQYGNYCFHKLSDYENAVLDYVKKLKA